MHVAELNAAYGWYVRHVPKATVATVRAELGMLGVHYTADPMADHVRVTVYADKRATLDRAMTKAAGQ